MKILIYISVFGLLSCNSRTQQSDKKHFNDTTPKVEPASKIDNSKYHTTQDTILIPTEIGDTLQYTKSGFNSIVDKHPEFFQAYPENPDQTYNNGNNKVSRPEIG